MRRILLLTLLLIPLNAWGYDTLIGCQVWLPKENAVRHFTSEAPFSPEIYGLKEPYFFVKEEILASRAFPLYKVTTAKGKTVYLFKGELERLVENLGVYLHPPGTIHEDYERELEENRKKAALRMKVDQVKAGIQKRLTAAGATYYLRRPLYGLSGLSEVKIENVEVKPDGSTVLSIGTLAGTIEESFRNPEEVATFMATSLYKTNPKWDRSIIDAIKNKRVLPGMSKEQVVASWGVPKDFNRTITKKTADEQWFYGSTTQLYFENDQLTGVNE